MTEVADRQIEAIEQRPHPNSLPGGEGTGDARVIVIATIIFAILSAWTAWASVGFLEADGITHYLARRFALGQPLHLVGVWSRPFCVALYAIPAHLGGLMGTRLTSLALVIVMMLITLAVAKRLNVSRPALVAIFLLTQPLLFAHSFSELTEVPFALLLIAIFWAYVSRQLLIMTLLTAIAPLARPEGFGLILVVAIGLLMHKRFWWIALLPLGIALWSYAGWRVYGGPTDYPWYEWLGRNWPYSTESQYGSGWPTKLIGVLPAVVGPMAFPLIWLGVWRVFSRSATTSRDREGADGAIDDNAPLRSRLVADVARRFLGDHDARCRMLIAIIPLGVLLGHTMLWTMGKMASNGEPRYMLIVAPFWALLAAIGWTWTCRRLSISRPILWTIPAALVPVAANLCWPVLPLGPQNDDRLARDAITWLDNNAQWRDRYPVFGASLPHLFMYLDRDRFGPGRVDISRDIARKAPSGTMLIWDAVYSQYNSDEALCVSETLLLQSGWHRVHEWQRGTYSDPLRNNAPRRMVVFVSPVDIEGRRLGLTDDLP